MGMVCVRDSGKGEREVRRVATTPTPIVPLGIQSHHVHRHLPPSAPHASSGDLWRLISRAAYDWPLASDLIYPDRKGETEVSRHTILCTGCGGRMLSRMASATRRPTTRQLCYLTPHPAFPVPKHPEVGVTSARTGAAASLTYSSS